LYGSSRIGELRPDESDQNTYRKATSRDGRLYQKEIEPVKEELKEVEAVEEKTMGLSIFNEWDYKRDPEDLQAPELVDDPKKSQIIIGLTDEDIAKIKEQLYTKEVQLDEVRRQQLEQDLARGYTLAQAQAVPRPTLESVYGPSYHMKWRYRGNRHYELDNHLGNVQVVITDKKIAHGGDNWEYYTADILSVHDYYAFGQDIEERNFERDTKYRYGMNGQEKEDDVFVGAFSAQYWEYDSRTGRRWNVDPVDQISISNYACFKNNPIWFVDPNGMQAKSDGGDPVPNPRISNDNAKGENSNRFLSVRVKYDKKTKEYKSRYHKGVDILAKPGTSVSSILDGTVRAIDYTTPNDKEGGKGLGNTIIIESKDAEGKPIFIKYAHLSLDSKNLKLEVGSSVKVGDQIAISGNTGNVIGRPEQFKHVHIEASSSIDFDDKSRLNPENYLKTKFDSRGQPIQVKPEIVVRAAPVERDATKYDLKLLPVGILTIPIKH
jgi:RHS repeat-associated protein